MSVKKCYGKGVKNVERKDRVTENGEKEVNLTIAFDNTYAQEAVYNLIKIIEEFKDEEILTGDLVAAKESWALGYIECLKASKLIDDDQEQQLTEIVYLLLHKLEKKETSDKKIQFWSDADIANHYIDRIAYNDEKAHKEAETFEKEIIRRFVNKHSDMLQKN